MTSKGAGDVDIDELLARWPAPSRDDLAWDESADAITAAAVAAGRASHEGLESSSAEALTRPVDLAPEPGEPASTSRDSFAQFTKGLGEHKKMSDDQNRGGSDPPVSSKKMSLKELAERVSKAPPSRTSQAPVSRGPTSTPMPGGPPPLPPSSAPTSTPVPSVRATSTPLPSSPASVRATSTPLPSSPASVRATSTPLPSRPSEAKSDDSGIVDLHAVRQAATTKEKEAAEKAQPATSGLFDEDDAPASKAPESSAAPASAAAGAPVSTAAIPKAAAAKNKSSNNVNLFIGVAVGVVGLAAAFAIVLRDKPVSNDTAKVVSETRLEAPAESQPAGDEEPQPEPPKDEGGLALDDLPAEEDETTAEPAAGGPAGVGGPLAKAEEGAKPEEPSSEGEETAKADKPKLPSGGDLASEIEKAAGSDGSTPEGAEPAAGNPKGKSQNIPAKPSQGSVQAAVGSVMGGAKACVAAADDVSRATITFSSSGAVQSVAVSGWAAGKGAAGCIKSALQGANVGPFSDASYTVGITIRP